MGISFTKSLHYLKVLEAYLRGRTEVSYLPTHLWIESTSRCNLRCPMCPTGMGTPREKMGFMAFDLFRSIMDQVTAARPVVYFHLAGEPTLHPDLDQMVKLCRERGVFSGFFTNGTVLREELGGRLITAGLDWIGFSFDGWDEESHGRYRVGSRFEKTVGNIETFLTTRRKLGSSTPYAILSMIDLPDSRTDEAQRAIAGLRQRLLAAGLDEFQRTPAHQWAGSDLPDPSLPGKIEGADHPTTRCPFPWSGLAIRYDGTFVPCCIDITGSYPMGKIQETPLADFWNGPRMRDLRDRMYRLDLDEVPICKGCHVVRDPRILGIPRRAWREWAELFRIRRDSAL